jgi:hypothetical protein
VVTGHCGGTYRAADYLLHGNSLLRLLDPEDAGDMFPPKRRLPLTGLHGDISQKIELFMNIVVRTQILKLISSICLCLPVFVVAPNLEHTASVKLFVSLPFLNPKTIGRTSWTGDQTDAGPLPTQDNTNVE